MTREDFLECVDSQKQQVFVMRVAPCLPGSVFAHTYLVVNDRGSLTRWDMLHHQNLGGTSSGYVHRDSTAPWCGIALFCWHRPFVWRYAHFTPRIVQTFDDQENITPLVAFLTSGAPFTYPFKNTYWFLGPNSNTFVAWVLMRFGISTDVLPWNALGKNYLT